MDVHTTTVQWVFMNLVLGIGSGFSYVALGVMLQAATAEEDMTSAVSLFTVFRPLGQALVVATGGVIFQNQIRNTQSCCSGGSVCEQRRSIGANNQSYAG